MITSETKFETILNVSVMQQITTRFAISIATELKTYKKAAKKARYFISNMYGWLQTYFIIIKFELISSIKDK